MDCSPSGSSIHGISQARILEWVVISSCRESCPPRNRTHVPCIAGSFFGTMEAYMCPCCCCCLVTSVVSNSVQPYGLQPARLPCPWDFQGKNTAMDCISLSRGSSQPRDQAFISYLLHWQVGCLPLAPLGSPLVGQMQRIQLRSLIT